MSGNNVDRLDELTGEFKMLVAVVLNACAKLECEDRRTWLDSALLADPSTKYTDEHVRQLVEAVGQARGAERGEPAARELFEGVLDVSMEVCGERPDSPKRHDITGALTRYVAMIKEVLDRTPRVESARDPAAFDRASLALFSSMARGEGPPAQPPPEA